MFKRNFSLIILTFLMIISLAATASAADEIVFQDNFSSGLGNWTETEEGSFSAVGGTLSVSSYGADTGTWHGPLITKNVTVNDVWNVSWIHSWGNTGSSALSQQQYYFNLSDGTDIRLKSTDGQSASVSYGLSVAVNGSDEWASSATASYSVTNAEHRVESNGTQIKIYFDGTLRHTFNSTAKLESISADFNQFQTYTVTTPMSANNVTVTTESMNSYWEMVEDFETGSLTNPSAPTGWDYVAGAGAGANIRRDDTWSTVNTSSHLLSNGYSSASWTANDNMQINKTFDLTDVLNISVDTQEFIQHYSSTGYIEILLNGDSLYKQTTNIDTNNTHNFDVSSYVGMNNLVFKTNFVVSSSGADSRYTKLNVDNLSFYYSVGIEYFSVIASDFFDNSSIDDFWVYANGNNFTSSEGVATTNIQSESLELWNITVGGDDYDTRIYYDVNVSDTLNASLVPFFSVIANDSNDGDALTNFWVYIDGTNITSSGETVVTSIPRNSSSLYNITIGKEEYYTAYYNDTNVSTNLNASLIRLPTDDIFYMETYNYATTAYEDCLNTPGNDLYDCYDVSYYTDWESRGLPALYAGLNDTGILTTSLDLARDKYNNDEYLRKEFGGQNTDLFTVEDSDSYSVVPNYLYVNYTKPAGALREETYWRFKHGHDGTNPLDEYITIPEDCWDLEADDGQILLRAYSSGHDVFVNETSYGECYDGSDWILISQNITGDENFGGLYTEDEIGRLTDGSYAYGTNYRNDVSEWYWAGNSYSKIYEESMWWAIQGIDPEVHFWIEEDEILTKELLDYYVRFWSYNEYNNDTEDLETISLFKFSKPYNYWNETWTGDEVWEFKLPITFSYYAPVANRSFEQFIDFAEVSEIDGTIDEDSFRLYNDDTGNFYPVTMLKWKNDTSGMIKWFVNESLSKDTEYTLYLYYATEELGFKTAEDTTLIQDEAIYCFQGDSETAIAWTSDYNMTTTLPITFTEWNGDDSENEEGVLEDFNNDGYIDMAFTIGSSTGVDINKFKVYLSDGTTDPSGWNNSYNYSAGGANDWGGITAGDFNEDGYMDLIVNKFNAVVTLLTNDGDGTFTPSTIQDIGTTQRKCDSGDFDNDDNLDIICAANTEYVYFIGGNGDGTFDAAVRVANSPADDSHGVTAIDVDLDGCLDIIEQPDSTYSYFYKGNCDGTFANAISLNGQLLDRGQKVDNGGNPTAVDYNKDGVVDLLTSSWGAYDMQVYWGSEDSLAAGGTTPSVFGDLSGTSGTNYSETTNNAIGKVMDCEISTSNMNGATVTVSSNVLTTGTDYEIGMLNDYFDLNGTSINSSNIIDTNMTYINGDDNLSLKYAYVDGLNIDLSTNEGLYGINFYGDNTNVKFDKYRASSLFLNVGNATYLNNTDSDYDGINDYDELFVYYTNPYKSDTDEGGESDYSEINTGSNPNLYADDVIITNELYVEPQNPYNYSQLDCFFNVTNNDPYAVLDTTVSWKTFIDENDIVSIPLDTNDTVTEYSTAEIDNGTAKTGLVPAPTVLMFTDAGCTKSGSRHADVACSKTIPITTDLQIVKYVTGTISNDGSGSDYGYVRFYYVDGTPYEQTANQADGTRTFINPLPLKEVSQIYIYARDDNYGMDDSPNARFTNVEVHGPLEDDGQDPNFNILTLANLTDKTIDRFFITGDIDGGSVDMSYSLEEPDFKETNLVMYQEFDECNSFGCALDKTRFVNDNYDSNNVEQINDSEYGYLFNTNESYVKIPDYYDAFSDIGSSQITNLRLLNGGTLCVYANITELNGTDYLIDKSSAAGGTDGYTFYYNESGNIYFNIENSANPTFTNDSQIVLNETHLYCVGFDNTTRNIYVDNVSVTINTTDITLPTNSTDVDLILGNNFEITNPINGTIYDVYIFDKKLSETELENVYDDITNDNFNIYESFNDFSINELVSLNETDYIRIKQEFFGTDVKMKNLTFNYHEFNTLTDLDTFDYTYNDITQNLLYQTTDGTGSYTGTIADNSEFVCVQSVDNGVQTTTTDSYKVGYYPLHNLTVDEPVNDTVTNEKFVTSFSVTDYEGDISCELEANGDIVGEFPYVQSDVEYTGGLQQVIKYTITEMNMITGCNGQISLSPNVDYPLEICLVDYNDVDVPGSCKEYTSGEYTIGDVLETNSINNSYLINGEKYKISLDWNRIGYVSMSNPLLDGNYDHGGTGLGIHNHKCEAYWTATNTICTNNVDDFKYATTQSACEQSDTTTATDNTSAYYTDSSCTTLLTNDVDFNYYSVSEPQRIYEGYYRTGGSDATISCTEALGKLKNDDCGTCLNAGNGGMLTDIWIPTSCSDGVEDDYPSDLCTNIYNQSSESDYFIYDINGNSDDIHFSTKIQAVGDVTWVSDEDTTTWPEVEGLYNWNIKCNSTNPIDNITSDTYTYYYDLTAPSISGVVSDETSNTPEIGQDVHISADASDTFSVERCELLVNDNGEWEVVDTDYDATPITNLTHTVRPYSRKDADIHPEYFRTGDIVWTKLSMENGTSIVLTISQNENVYELYESSPEDVFEFFESFDGDSLNESIWTSVSNESSTVTVTGGEMTFVDDDSDNADYYETIEKFYEPHILEWRGKEDTTEEWPLEVAFGHGTSNTIGKIKNRNTQDHYIFKSYKNGVPLETGDFTAINSYENFRIVWNDGASELYRDDVLIGNLTDAPYIDSSVAFGDLTADGANDDDTKGILDWMFVRQYSDNMPNITCTDNICLIEANNGDIEDLQVPLETSYLAGNLSLVYSIDNTEVEYKVKCYDDSGNSEESSIYTFTVKDNTNPQITIGDGNSFEDDNQSVISSALYDLNLEIDYFDYNLFQAYEKVTCEESGVIYEWEDIDVEVFNYDIVSNNTYNTSDAFDPYDDTYAYVNTSTTQDGYVGQEFDSFYHVESVDYNITTNDSNIKIQTYDGYNWNTEYEYARGTDSQSATLIINDTIKGIRYLFDNTSSVTNVSQKVYYMKYVYNSGLANNGASYEHISEVSLEGLPMQKCEFFASASDDHTDNNISDYKVEINDLGLEYNTENDIVADIKYEGSANEIKEVSTNKIEDRYTFDFDFTNYATERTFIVSSKNGHPIYPRGNSRYPGHLVIWNPEKKSGNWVDFNELGDTFKDYIIERIDNYNYKVIVKTDVPVNKLQFESIGGTNVYNETWEFYIGGALNVTGDNIYDGETFANYTYTITTINSTPGIEETYTPTTDQYYIGGLSEGIYNISFTHPEFFNKSYIVNMTRQYTEESENTTAGTSFENDTFWTNSSNIFDGNISTGSEVTSAGFTYAYVNYTTPEDAVYAKWNVTAFGEGESTLVNLTLNDTIQLRFRVKDGLNDSFYMEQYVGGSWVDLSYNNVTYNETIYEENIVFGYEAPHLIYRPFSSYQSAISFNVTDVKSHSYLSDLNITLRNQETGQNDTIVYPYGTYIDTFYVNADTEYTVDVQKNPYIRYQENYTFDYQEEETYTLEMSYYSTLNIYDEKTLLPFDFADPASVEFLVFCPDRTESYDLNASVMDVPITCDYDKFKFILTYAGGTGYYRKLVVDHADSFNQSIYLMDITDTPYVYTAFIVDDLMGKYENPSIWIKKAMGEEVVVIQSDYTDIEDKVGSYLIENDEYIIEVHSDNQPIQVIGDYGADVGEDKIISMYDVNLDSDPTGFSQSVSYTMRIINDTETNETSVQFAYTDLDELTESVQFRVYADRLNGTLIYESDVYHNTSEIGSLIVPLTGYENRTVVGDIEIVHAEAGTQHASKLLNKDWGIGMGLQDHVSQEFLNWFFIILLSVVAIMSSIKTSMSALVVTALAFVFMLFGWMAISGGVLALAILISLLDFLAKRKGR